jgi:AraC family transcriptional regulator, transcriptional activator of pobA
MMNHIPIHILQDRTNLGLQIRYFHKDQAAVEKSIPSAHRDDHYIFFVLEEGMGSMMIDFSEVQLNEKSLYYVLPGQVHYQIRGEIISGWFIAVDTGLVPQECRNVFEGQLLVQQPYPLDSSAISQCKALLTLLFEKFMEEDANPFRMITVHALLQSFISIAAGYYNQSTGHSLQVSRPAQLSGQFKKLLHTELKSCKSPSDYASRLNISESYLSEALKKQTGFPPSYWILQEVIMEAKRLLYYSQLSVKEIAHTLGYDDHSYFSRLFRKATGTSAIAFRQQYRK